MRPSPDALAVRLRAREGVAPTPRVGLAAFVEALEADAAFADVLVHREHLPARPPRSVPELPARFAALAPVLERRGIAALYSHQARALAQLEEHRDVVLATSTASGKTLVYALSTLRRALDDPTARALYLFPLKALSRDQQRGLEADAAALGRPDLRVAVYDGDTPAARRRALRDDPPSVLITTPDMLHAGILPHHGLWRTFFERLELVVIDELHTYRGIFGAHVAQVIRRLERVARHHGAVPRIVAASATLANPGELAHSLTGRRLDVIVEDGAPRSARDVLLFRPKASPYTLAAQLFRAALARGLRTIAFTKARVVTELLHSWVVDAEPELASRISSYRAGFLPAERREIERRLFDGSLCGVIATSALELGIDVGSLDVCILVGYPGSQVATWQRGGRVGRRGDAAIALVAQPDALDQYLVTHPRVFFERSFEHAVLDPHNPEVASAHLPCAAAELPLCLGEPWLDEPETRAHLATLEERAVLLRSDTENEWFAARRRPHREVSLRQAGSSYEIVALRRTGEEGDLVGSIGVGNVFAECHEGAIYLHRGRQYYVTELDVDERAVRVRGVDVPYYTRALSEKETEIVSRQRSRPAGNFRLTLGRVRVTTRISGYERRRVHGQDLLATEPLDLPPTAFESTGVWLEMPPEIPAALEAQRSHVMGAIHAVEHASLSLFPLFALCDRHDVAGISYTCHPQIGCPAIFFYDSHAGGVGITASLFDRIESLLEATLELIRDCPCEEGCPGCVHSPRCSNGNRPIDKQGAIRTLELLLCRQQLPALRLPAPTAPPSADPATVGPAEAVTAPAPRLVFLDVETQRSADEVGGWHNAHLMRIAVAVLYDSASARYECFDEAGVPELLLHLEAADLVVGFNVLRFDYMVLRGYTDRDLRDLPTFDLLDDVHRRIGFRLPMGHLAEETLGIPKSADGLQSLAWWKAGLVQRVADYCRRDVEILRALFEHGVRDGHLCFRTRNGERVRLPARWNVAELIEAARAAAQRDYALPRGRRRGGRSSSSKSIRAVTGSAAAIVTSSRSPSS